MILLVAPAGYGKTTLARQWAERQSGPVAWYRTTRVSGDVAALAVGLDKLLAETAPPAGRDPRRIASIAAVNPRPEPLARALVSTYASLPAELLLVLDEWEAAATEDADTLVGALVDELPIRVIVTSRTRPHWLASRLQVYGEALEIGLDELSMTDEEARGVLWPGIGKTDIQSLLDTARGWPAVLGLAALTAGRTRPPRELLP